MGLDQYLRTTENVKSLEIAKIKTWNKNYTTLFLNINDEFKNIEGIDISRITILNNKGLLEDYNDIWGLEPVKEFGTYSKTHVHFKYWVSELEEFEHKQIALSDIKRIEFNAKYWRKANQIHNWFVTNIQDGIDNCGSYLVTGEQVQELVDICKQVLSYKGKRKKAIKKLREVAQDLLPTQSGFFFGSTDYDEWYVRDLEETVKALDGVCLNKIFAYESSW